MVSVACTDEERSTIGPHFTKLSGSTIASPIVLLVSLRWKWLVVGVKSDHRDLLRTHVWWWRQKHQDREEQRSKRIRSCSAMATCWQHHKMWGAAGGFADDHLKNNYGCMAALREMILDMSDVGIVIHSKRILWHCWNWKWSSQWKISNCSLAAEALFWLKDVWCGAVVPCRSEPRPEEGRRKKVWRTFWDGHLIGAKRKRKRSCNATNLERCLCSTPRTPNLLRCNA